MLGTACFFNWFLVKKSVKREISGKFSVKAPYNRTQCFFFPEKPKPTREATFFAFFLGWIFFFSPTFFQVFSGSFKTSRALFLIFSRVENLFFSGRNLRICRYFSDFHGTFCIFFSRARIIFSRVKSCCFFLG